MAGNLTRRGAVLLAVAVAAAVLAPAAGAVPPPLGGLTQLSGSAGCTSDDGSAGACADGNALGGAAAVVVSPDGRSAYVASAASNAIAVFARDPATGKLTELAGTAGCVRTGVGEDGCTDAVRLAGVSALAVSADGRNVYAAASGAAGDAVLVFARDTTTGALTQLAGRAGCVRTGVAEDGCSDALALSGPKGVAASPDGLNVYVAAGTSDAIAIFSRDPATGALTQLAGASGCISEAGSGGACVNGKGLDGANGVTVGLDGKSVYVASSASDAIAIFSRDSGTGALTQLGGTAGCISETGSGSLCTNGKALDGAAAVAASLDGKSVYVAASVSDAVAVFARDLAGGSLTQLPGTAGCVSDTGSSGACADGTALDGAQALAASPDHGHVYVASGGSDAVAVFARDTGSGGLTQFTGTGACVSDTGSAGACGDGTALDGAASVAVSPGGESLYAAASASNAVSAFARELPPACTGSSQEVQRGTPTKVALACSDPNGDPLTHTIVAAPLNGTLAAVDEASASVVYTPALGFVGSDTFAFKASDGSGESAVTSVTIQVLAPVDREGPKMRLAPGALKLTATGVVRLRLFCPPAELRGCSGTVTLRTAARIDADRVLGARRRVILGRKAFQILGGRTGVVDVQLSARNRDLVRALRSLRVQVLLVARDRTGNTRRTTLGRMLRASR